jgi:hypothetical protein
MNSVKVGSNQASAARLWHAARGAERLGTICKRVKEMLRILLNIQQKYLYIISCGG